MPYQCRRKNRRLESLRHKIGDAEQPGVTVTAVNAYEKGTFTGVGVQTSDNRTSGLSSSAIPFGQNFYELPLVSPHASAGTGISERMGTVGKR